MTASRLLYRAYLLRSDGHFHRAEVLQAKDDEAALDMAAALDNAHGIEVWDRGRFVGKVLPQTPTLLSGGVPLPGFWDRTSEPDGGLA